MRYVAVVIVLVCGMGCSADYEERLLPCSESAIIKSAHSFGDTITVRTSPTHEVSDLFREPWRGYGTDPLTIEEMERRYGRPLRSWEEEGRPFVEYVVPSGRLQLGLEEDRSGSHAFREWRLRWKSDGIELAEVIERSVLECVGALIRPDFELLLPDDEIGASIHVRGSEVREVIWNRHNKPRSSG